jgi:hypothetical protein
MSDPKINPGPDKTPVRHSVRDNSGKFVRTDQSTSPSRSLSSSSSKREMLPSSRGKIVIDLDKTSQRSKKKRGNDKKGEKESVFVSDSQRLPRRRLLIPCRSLLQDLPDPNLRTIYCVSPRIRLPDFRSLSRSPMTPSGILRRTLELILGYPMSG